ncbi:Hypothetical predicted protein [Xyrichtys novacula]|uniref:Ig-like domain-containing protein n=1 Tax=Xyrichtys novacula TaxID=13765 RepID=A0AAV1H2D3_XYRNO|nr:Hypothetical predicted protein [Xyrichtys novacula]
MLKYQCVCHSLMDIMFYLNQAALLSLLFTCQVHAAHNPPVQRNMLVSRGDPVKLICNESKPDEFIKWTKGRRYFSYAFIHNKQNLSTLTSDRLTIDVNSPSKLMISNAQDSDGGLYTCEVTSDGVILTIQWNLTVSEKPKENGSFSVLLHIVIPLIGVFLCCIVSAVCLCRKLRHRTPNQNSIQEPFYESVGETAQSSTDRRTNNKRRSQYMERLNSIYNAS